MKSKSKDRLIPLVAISGIVILEAIALYKGINGVMFGTAMTVIGGIAGYSVKMMRP